MSDFPRGWTFNSAVGAGSAAGITVPATPGVVHVLDAIFARLINAGTGASAAVNVTATIGAVTVVNTQLVVPATVVAADEFSLSGLDLATAPGGSLVVTFSIAAPAGYAEVLIIQGHDI